MGVALALASAVVVLGTLVFLVGLTLGRLG